MDGQPVACAASSSQMVDNYASATKHGYARKFGGLTDTVRGGPPPARAAAARPAPCRLP